MSRIARIFCSTFLSIVGCGTNLQAASLFPHAVLYPSGNQPTLGTVADFNGDGNADVLLIAQPGKQSRLSVLPGIGGGKFGTVIDSPDLHHAVDQVVAGDMNGDGFLDVVALTYSHSSLYVSVNLGNGDGTFAELEQDIAGGSYAGTRLLVADFNNDGYLDAALPTYNSSHFRLTVLLNAGDGHLTPPVNTVTNADFSQAQVSDFNHDGNADIAAISEYYPGSEMWVILGSGDGTFQKPVQLGTSTQYFGFNIGDFNADGNDDLAVIDWETQVEIWNGNGDGTFRSPKLYPAVDGAIQVGEFNGDGFPDLLIDSFGWSQTVLMNKGSNSGFGVPIGYRSGVLPLIGVSSAMAADVNQDGRTDLIITAPHEQATGILLNRGGLLSEAQSYTPKGSLPKGIVAADFNGDGKPDVMVGDDHGTTLFLQRAGGLYSPVDVPGLPACYQILPGDFNGDQKADIAFTATANAGIFLGNGDGTFNAPRFLPDHAYDIALGDFNNDHLLDLAATTGPSGVDIFLGKGDGTFQSRTNYAVALGAARIAAVDVNNDGYLDIVVAYSASISQLLGNGDGTFAAATTVDDKAFVRLSALTTADVNNDGNADLLLVGFGKPRSLLMYLGNGDGTYQAKRKIPLDSGNAPVALAVADFNRDGFVDIVVGMGSDWPGYIPSLLFLGNGDGTFQSSLRIPYSSGVDYFGVAAADMNLDGWPDLLLGDSLLRSVVVVPNVVGK